MKDEHARYLYLREEMAESDEASRLMTAKEEGREEGRREGHQEGEKASKEDRQRDPGNDGKIMDTKREISHTANAAGENLSFLYTIL